MGSGVGVVGSEVVLVLSRDARLRGTPLDGYVGFGTPRVVRHPDTREPWLLFTAWSDVSGLAREIWAAPIRDEYGLELDLSRAKKVATGSSVGVTGLASVDVFFDYVDEEWLLFATTYGGDPARVYVIVADKYFSPKTHYAIDTGVNLGDGGFSIESFENDLALIGFTAYGNEGTMFKLSSFTDRPPSIGVVGSYMLPPISLPDVHKMFSVGGRLYVMYETLDNTGQWHIHLAIGPYRAWQRVDAAENLGRFVFPVSIKSPIPYTSPWEKTSYGHPEYANTLKQPVLMFTSFRHCHWPGKDTGLKWAHEIIAFKAPFNYFADPRTWLPAIYIIDMRRASKNIVLDTAGASKILIYAYKQSASYNMIIRGGGDANHLANEDGYYYEESVVVDTAPFRYVIDPAPPYLGLKTSAPGNIGEIIIYLLS